MTLMDFDDDTDPDKLAILEELEYRCQGSPSIAHRVQSLLTAAGLPCQTSSTRGMDHGHFHPALSLFLVN